MKTLYKSLPADMTRFGHKFEVGKWYKEDKISICNRGFHASVRAIDAMNYVNCEVLALVEVKGKSEKEKDKQCWSEMKLLKTYKWTKKDSVALSIYSAELVLKNFEKEFPDDDRPRKAIEAAKKVLENDTKKNRDAARSAVWSAVESAESAVWSAVRSAESAVWSAVESAESAVWSAVRSAESAVWSAVRSAESARSAARSAVRSAAYEKTLDKIEEFIHIRIGF